MHTVVWLGTAIVGVNFTHIFLLLTHNIAPKNIND
jgi:hypothetical protein